MSAPLEPGHYRITEVIQQKTFDIESPAPYAKAEYMATDGSMHILEVQPANLLSVDILNDQFKQQVVKIEEKIDARKTIDPAILAQLEK